MNETTMELYGKLSKLQWLMHRKHMQTHAVRGPMADTSRGQGRVLAMLKLQPQISTKDLSYLLGIRQQSLNELLTKLEKGAYITRTPSETDKRVMMIGLTEKGQNEQPEEKNNTSVFSCLNEEEQTTFSQYLDRMIALLVEQLGCAEENQEACEWAAKFRERMGEEWFEKIIAMKHSGFFGRHGFSGHGSWGGCAEDFHHKGHCHGDHDGGTKHGCKGSKNSGDAE